PRAERKSPSWKYSARVSMNATPTATGNHQVGLVIAPNHTPVPKASTKKMPSTVQPAAASGTKVATKNGEISMPAIHRISGMGANFELRPDASESDGGLGVLLLLVHQAQDYS